MKEFDMWSRLRGIQKETSADFFWDIVAPALGLIPLAYVLYAGFFDLPPILTTLTIFAAIFIGLTGVMYWRKTFFIAPLFLIYLCVFFLPLTWLWRGLEFDQNVLMGIFPFNDGMYYYTDANRLFLGLGQVLAAPNGRPLYTGLFAFFLWLCNGNSQAALALFCAGTAISIFLLALEIREIAGPTAAGLVTTILFFFYLPFLGRIHTEDLGLNLGALALALLLKGVRKNSLAILAFGGAAISVALNARAGAFFVLPMLVLWGWFNRKSIGGKTPYVLFGAVSVGFFLNIFLANVVGAGGGGLFSNYGHTLYGLASGYKGWDYIYTVHPEFNNGTNVFPLALELIRDNPTLLFLGILSSYRQYFTPREMFTLLSFGEQQSLISWILFLITIVGFYRLVRSRNKLYGSLILFLLAGILFSVALVPPIDSGIRAMMATHPVNALLAGLAFLPIRSGQRKNVENINAAVPEVYAIVLAAACVMGPLLVAKYHPVIPPLPELGCPEGTEQISVILSPGSYINIIRDGERYGFIPEVRREDIKVRLDDYHYQGNLPYILTEFPTFERLIKRLKPGETILMGINLLELNVGNGPDQFVFLITRTERIQQIGEVNHFCARLSTADRLNSNRFYYEMSLEAKE